VEITEELILIGEDDNEDPRLEFDKLTPGDVFSRRQDLYPETDETWGKGPLVGTAYLSVTVARGDVGICEVVFVLQDEDTIVAHGVLPVNDSPGGATIGNGYLSVTGGTGSYNAVMGRVDVEVVNPKRYHFTI
jgi:hypothetical protein